MQASATSYVSLFSVMYLTSNYHYHEVMNNNRHTIPQQKVACSWTILSDSFSEEEQIPVGAPSWKNSPQIKKTEIMQNLFIASGRRQKLAFFITKDQQYQLLITNISDDSKGCHLCQLNKLSRVSSASSSTKNIYYYKISYSYSSNSSYR
jgi:hypothetical protein